MKTKSDFESKPDLIKLLTFCDELDEREIETNLIYIPHTIHNGCSIL